MLNPPCAFATSVPSAAFAVELIPSPQLMEAWKSAALKLGVESLKLATTTLLFGPSVKLNPEVTESVSVDGQILSSRCSKPCARRFLRSSRWRFRNFSPARHDCSIIRRDQE